MKYQPMRTMAIIGTAEAKYHRMEGYAFEPWKMSTFMPKKEEMNVRGRKMNVIQLFQEKGQQMHRNRDRLPMNGTKEIVGRSKVPQSPHACTQLQAMPTVPDAYGFVHQISQIGRRLDEILLY